MGETDGHSPVSEQMRDGDDQRTSASVAVASRPAGGIQVFASRSDLGERDMLEVVLDGPELGLVGDRVLPVFHRGVGP